MFKEVMLIVGVLISLLGVILFMLGSAISYAGGEVGRKMMVWSAFAVLAVLFNVYLIWTYW